MNVRDALEADADALASIADSPTDVMRNLVHDRTVRVAEDGTHDPNADVGDTSSSVAASHADGDDDDDAAAGDGRPDNAESTQYGGSDPEDLLGFVSFDVQGDTVHVTQIGGTEDACERLLAEPVRFASGEGLAVEILVPRDDEPVEEAAASLGFDNQGLGPRFDGDRTIRFRLEP